MNKLEPSKGRRMSRNQRVDRGANLVMAAGVSVIIFIVTFLLSILDVIGALLPVLSLVAAGIFSFLAYRTVKR